MVDGKQWNGRGDSIASTRIGQSLYELTESLERHQLKDPLTKLVPVAYRLGYAAAVMDKLDGGCRLARHLALAGRPIERQKQSLHSLFPSKYGPCTDASENINDDETVAEEDIQDGDKFFSDEQLEINGECLVHERRCISFKIISRSSLKFCVL